MNHFFKIILLISLISVSGYSQIRKVPQDYSSIQSAILAAHIGDTVMIDTGRYFENINFRGKSIVVASKYILTNDISFISKTIIDGSKPSHPDSASCVLLLSSEGEGAVLEGLTLTKGTGTPIKGYVEGGGVLLNKSNAIIKNNIIVENNVATGGGGIASWYGKPQILNNLIINNIGGYAAGIVLNWSDGIIKNNIVYHNIKTGPKWLTGGIMIWDSPGNPIIENNVVVGNISNTTAGGISITAVSKPVIRNNIVWGNRQATGKQITGATAGMVTFCDVEDKTDGTGNFCSFPVLSPDFFTLGDNSPCIDKGDTNSVYNDKNTVSQGTLRNDIGAFGGPGATLMNEFYLEDIYFSKKSLSFGTLDVGKEKSLNFEMLNLGTGILKIDSVQSSNELHIEIKDELHPVENDTVVVTWEPVLSGTFTDTVKIFHSYKEIENPQKIVLTGSANAVVSDLNNPVNAIETLDILPNPCTNGCIIKYKIHAGTFVTLGVYNLNGNLVDLLINSEVNAGDHECKFNRENLEDGIYILNLTTTDAVFKKKMIIE